MVLVSHHIDAAERRAVGGKVILPHWSLLCAFSFLLRLEFAQLIVPYHIHE